jgi:hypothetical protein
MRPAGLISCIQCKVLTCNLLVLTCNSLVLHIALYVYFDFINAKVAAKRMLIFCRWRVRSGFLDCLLGP